MVSQTYKKSKGVQDLLLDTAERLFARKGYYGVSVRDITSAADVRNASINYHFGSKEALFAAVIERRIIPLAKARLDLLKEVEPTDDDTAQSVRATVHAFAQPMFDFVATGEAGWKDYCTLIAHISVQKHMSEAVIAKRYDNVAREFLAVLAAIFPEADDYRIQCAFQFMLGATLYSVCDNKRIDGLSDGRYRSDDFASLGEPCIDYVSGGIVSMLA